MSIFNDKALKSVAEAAAKIMGEQLKGNQHKIDANKNGKVDAHDFKLLRAGKKDMKKEEVGLDEAKTQSKEEKDKVVGAVTKAMRQSYANVMQGRNERAAARMNAKIKNKMKEEVEATEQEQLNEAFPTVADAKKRMDAGKTEHGSVTKTATGLVHKRDYKDDNDEDDAPKKKGYGARQNYKRSTRVNESLSFTEMLELYNEHGLKVLAPIETEEMDVDGTTIEVIDADKVNGFVETTIEEEATEEEFNKELKDQQASFEGKKKQPKVAAGKTTGVKEMPESVELEERELSKDEAKKKEDYVKGMKKGLSGFKERYGERAKSVMYATATSMAKKKS